MSLKMKEIKIGGHKKNSKIILFSVVDDEDFDKINKYKWSILTSGNKKYACRQYKKDGKIKRIFLHRYIMNTEDNKIQIDHIDGNTMNNQKSNLRSCSPKENCYNKKVASNNTSGYKGVWSYKHMWVASIQKDNKKFHCGRFENKEDAKEAYNKKAEELFGDFANLNICDMSTYKIDSDLENNKIEKVQKIIKSLKNNDHKKKYYCIDCDVFINKSSERCKHCYGKLRVKKSSKNGRPSLEQLEKDIKETNFVKTGKKYNVSDNCIRKWIKNYKKYEM
jgi:hypothetical protein